SAGVMDREFEHRPIARSNLEALNIVQGVGGIAAAVDGAEQRANYMKIREQVGANVDEKNAYQLANLDRNRMAHIVAPDPAIEHHKVRLAFDHLAVIRANQAMSVRGAVDLALHQHHLAGLAVRPAAFRVDYHHSVHSFSNMIENRFRSAMVVEYSWNLGQKSIVELVDSQRGREAFVVELRCVGINAVR